MHIGEQGLAGADLPDAYGEIQTRGSQSSSIRRPGDIPNTSKMPGESAHIPVCCDIPDMHQIHIITECERFAIRRPGHSVDSLAIMINPSPFACHGIPDLDSHVATGRGDIFAVG